MGDYILSRDEFAVDSENSVQIVEDVFIGYTGIMELGVGGRIIRTTVEHPFYVKDRGWTKANHLQPGDLLATQTGGYLPCESVNPRIQFEQVYNVRIRNFHTYFVGCDEWGFSVWAHNACSVTIVEQGGEFLVVNRKTYAVEYRAKSLQDASAYSLDAGFNVSTQKLTSTELYFVNNQAKLARPPVERTAGDINLQATKPVPPEPEIYVNGNPNILKQPGGGVSGRPGAGNAWQTPALKRDLQAAQEMGATDIRIRQNQVNASGVQVGGNKPDLQYTVIVDGKPRRVYVEYDNLRPPSAYRGNDHYDRILANDPDAIIILRGN